MEEKRQRPDDEDAGDEEGCIECSRPGLIIYCDSCDGGRLCSERRACLHYFLERAQLFHANRHGRSLRLARDAGYCLECAGLTYENIPPEEDPWSVDLALKFPMSLTHCYILSKIVLAIADVLTEAKKAS